MSFVKDVTSEERNMFSFSRILYTKTYSKSQQEKTYVDNSTYLIKKKSIAIGKPVITSAFTKDNKLEIKQAKKLLRSRR